MSTDRLFLRLADHHSIVRLSLRPRSTQRPLGSESRGHFLRLGFSIIVLFQRAAGTRLFSVGWVAISLWVLTRWGGGEKVRGGFSYTYGITKKMFLIEVAFDCAQTKP